LDNITYIQNATVTKSSHTKDVSHRWKFLRFCEGLGIPNNEALPAKEDLSMAWAASYAGHLAGKTVSAKLLVIRKKHERRGLIWQGGILLQCLLKEIEELRPVSSFCNK
jgi:hypothetical protein